MKSVIKINIIILLVAWGLVVDPCFCISGNHLHDREHHTCKHHQHQDEDNKQDEVDIHCDNSLTKSATDPRQLLLLIPPTIFEEIGPAILVVKPIAILFRLFQPRHTGIIPLLN